MKLVIAETFCSIQGEGHLSGKRMFFIRLAGCSVTECQLHPNSTNPRGKCDTDWSMSYVLRDETAIEQLAARALSTVGASGWICITGGEPTDQEQGLSYLVSCIHRLGGKVNIQTSGKRRVNCQWDWLTVSPKVEALKLDQKYGQELKLVITGQKIEEIRDYYIQTRFWNYYIQPLWSGEKECNMTRCLDLLSALNDGGQPWELSLQMHKHIGVL